MGLGRKNLTGLWVRGESKEATTATTHVLQQLTQQGWDLLLQATAGLLH